MPLKKRLNFWDVFCIATGEMISAGLFILPGIAQAQVGPAVFLCYLFAGLLTILAVLNQAELVSAMPNAGGAYFYVARSMGPAVGSIYGLTIWLSMTAKSIFALLGIAIFTNLIVNTDIRIIAIGLCLFFITLNILGIKEASIAQNIMVLILFGGMITYVLLGIPAMKAWHFHPFLPKGISSIFYTTGFVFVSYGGLIQISSIAEEVKNPRKTMPLALLLSIVAVTIFYTLMVFTTTGVLDADKLYTSLTPISDGAAVFMGFWGKVIMGIAAIMAFVTTANAGIMVSSRYPLAGARDGLLPEFLGRVNKRFHTPHYAILATGAFMVLVLFLNFDMVVRFASGVTILVYFFSFLPALFFRASRLKYYKPSFRAPFYPWLQIFGIIVFAFFLILVNKEFIWLNFIIIIGMIVAYIICGRFKTKRKHALLYVIDRICGKLGRIKNIDK